MFFVFFSKITIFICNFTQQIKKQQTKHSKPTSLESRIRQEKTHVDQNSSCLLLLLLLLLLLFLFFCCLLCVFFVSSYVKKPKTICFICWIICFVVLLPNKLISKGIKKKFNSNICDTLLYNFFFFFFV